MAAVTPPSIHSCDDVFQMAYRAADDETKQKISEYGGKHRFQLLPKLSKEGETYGDIIEVIKNLKSFKKFVSNLDSRQITPSVKDSVVLRINNFIQKIRDNDNRVSL